MSTQANIPKGILKPITQASPRSPREIALFHANLLQNRKDLESEILDSLILLSAYPLVRSAPFSACAPAPSDVSGFKTHVRLFQPSDFDDLIEERNVNGLCGYALCMKPRRRLIGAGKWKIISSGEIVKRQDLEKWCSPQCSKRAMFIKVQLDETAAWERAGLPHIQIHLYEEQGWMSAGSESHETGDFQVDHQRRAARDAAALALERGEQSSDGRPTKVKVDLVENLAPASSVDISHLSSTDHRLVEGHKVDIPLRPKNKR